MAQQQPPLPLTYTDLVCLDDADLFASETGSDLENLEQDVYHILIETPGSNPDDTSRGIGVEQLLGSASQDTIPEITSLIDAQLKKDDRIDSCTSTLTQLPPGSTLPDGTPLPDGGWLLELDIVPDSSIVGTATLGLAYGYSSSGGLVPQ
jgi:hypothetical protein